MSEIPDDFIAWARKEAAKADNDAHDLNLKGNEAWADAQRSLAWGRASTLYEVISRLGYGDE